MHCKQYKHSYKHASVGKRPHAMDDTETFVFFTIVYRYSHDRLRTQHLHRYRKIMKLIYVRTRHACNVLTRGTETTAAADVANIPAVSMVHQRCDNVVNISFRKYDSKL